MTLAEFIRENKPEIDQYIRSACNNCKLNNEERRLWILNDEGLYSWAKSEGVRI